MVTTPTDPMVVVVMAIVVVDMVGLNTGEAMVTTPTDPMVVVVMAIVVVDMVGLNTGGVTIIAIISGDCSFTLLLSSNWYLRSKHIFQLTTL
jgi:hypothetical protein